MVIQVNLRCEEIETIKDERQLPSGRSPGVMLSPYVQELKDCLEELSLPPRTNVKVLRNGNEDTATRFDFPGDVSFACGVFGKKDVSGAKAPPCPIATFYFTHPTERNDELAPRCGVKGK